MNFALRKILRTLLLALASMLPMKTNGQDIWQIIYPKPTEPINYFISQDSTPQALEYNALNNKESRDAIQIPKLLSDITSKITGTGWSCNKADVLYVRNSHKFGKDVFEYGSNTPVYDGYDGDDVNEILLHGGTTKYFGTLGIPVYDNEIHDPVTMTDGHGNNEVLTGDRVNNAKDWNTIEVPPPWNMTNLKPGQIPYIPANCERFMIYYSYTYKDATQKTILARIPAVLFKIVNGEFIFQGTNPNVKIIMDRENDPPIINIDDNSDPDHLTWNIIEKNLKRAYFMVDDDTTKTMLGQSGTTFMHLPIGIHNITIFAEDYFRLNSEKTIQREIMPKTVTEYPNPTIGPITITHPKGNTTIEIYNSTGKLLEQIVNNDQNVKTEMNIERYKPGLYIYGAMIGNQRYTGKIIKKF